MAAFGQIRLVMREASITWQLGASSLIPIRQVVDLFVSDVVI